jgi:hypothetical protein
MNEYMYVCLYVCIYVCTYVCIYMCICVCVCVCVRYILCISADFVIDRQVVESALK